MITRLVATAVALAVLLGGPAVRAAEPRRVGVLKFHGPAEGLSRVTVMRAAKANRFLVIGAKQIEKTAKRLKVKLDASSGFEAVARTLGIAAFVTGEVTRRKATLTVRNGDGGGVADESSWTAPDPRRLATSVGRTFWKRLGPAIEKATPPRGAKLDVAAEEETVAEDTDAASPGDDDARAEGKAEDRTERKTAAPSASAAAAVRARNATKAENAREEAAAAASHEDGDGDRKEVAASKRARPPADESSVEPLDEALSLAVGPRFGMRSLSYVDDRYGMNSDYSLAKAALVGADADFFPGALSSRGALASIGVTGSFTYQLPIVKSKFLDSDKYYTTHSLSWSLGLKVRLPVGLFLTAAVGSHFYEVVDDPTAHTDVPTTNYQFVRGGGGMRRRLSPTLLFMAHGAYLHCLKVGPIGDAGFYPSATGAGFEAGAGFGYLVTPSIELRAGVDVQRFALDFHVKLDDALKGARTAGGAIDQYTEVWLAVAFVLAPGSGPAPASRAPAASSAPVVEE